MVFCNGDGLVAMGDDEDPEKFGAYLKEAFEWRPSTKIGFG